MSYVVWPSLDNSFMTSCHPGCFEITSLACKQDYKIIKFNVPTDKDGLCTVYKLISGFHPI